MIKAYLAQTRYYSIILSCIPLHYAYHAHSKNAEEFSGPNLVISMSPL